MHLQWEVCLTRAQWLPQDIAGWGEEDLKLRDLGVFSITQMKEGADCFVYSMLVSDKKE